MTNESNRLEYKRQLTDDLEKEVIAFLNYRDGGVIYIGIDKTGAAIGVAECEEVQLKIKNRLRDKISPSTMGLFDVVLEQVEGKEVIKITVASGLEKPYHLRRKGMTEQGCFIRVGSASEPMPQRMIEDLFSRRVRNSIGTIKSRNQDLSFEQLKIYYSGTSFHLNDQFARNLELLTEDEKYNYAAYLLSDINGLSMKVAKYAGTDRVKLIENEEYGYCSIIKSTKAVLEKLRIENRTFAKITYEKRLERKLFNQEALHEAVINAIIHNDFSNEVPPKFELFADRLEITSAGGIPQGLSESDFFMGYSVPQNKELMRIFRDLDMVEQLGSGIPRILAHYPQSIYHFTPNFIRLVIPYAEGFDETINNSQLLIDNYPLATPQATGQAAGQATGQAEKLLEYCKSPRSTKEMMDHLGVNHREHFRDTLLLPLLESGDISLTIPDKPKSPKQKYVTVDNYQLITDN